MILFIWIKDGGGGGNSLNSTIIIDYKIYFNYKLKYLLIDWMMNFQKKWKIEFLKIF